MKTDTVDSWDEFERRVSDQRERVAGARVESFGGPAGVLYRGHGNADWTLTTTLERYAPDREFGFKNYNRYMDLISRPIQSMTGKEWTVEREFEPNQIIAPPSYEFMVYTRHHGFPSPLLDWSASPYVALFFAYEGIAESRAESIGIYSYEHLSPSRGGWVGDPSIRLTGPMLNTHGRHYRQQCEYTICVQETPDDCIYASHDSYVEQCEDGRSDEVFEKWTMPAGLKNEILDRLQFMNINAFTLFGSEEGLMHWVAHKYMATRERELALIEEHIIGLPVRGKMKFHPRDEDQAESE